MLASGAMLPAAVGGTLAGGLHGISGPDHLAALLPLCLGRRWHRAAGTGALWGLGHGVGAALVGALGFALRGLLNMDRIAAYMEIAVGVSIFYIGATGFREAREWASNVETCGLDESESESAMHKATRCDDPPPQAKGP